MDGVRAHLLRLLGNLVEPMSNTELAKLCVAAGAIISLEEVSLVRAAALEEQQLQDPGAAYFWDRQ